MRRPNGDHYWRVYVGERHRLHTDLAVQRLDQTKELAATAAMLAETLGRRFGYTVDPSGAYQAAERAYNRLIREPAALSVVAQ